ncbi:hypothetical protein DCAR_0520353 [Daucus carota subsp. sativus]|uniref:Myb-like domain-containing protein n=1 Tax=Daucus carota subsp. sativus TaxID=79200 RepID=A0A164YHG8_DAUCS|nr:hypothetical protein DCAR_0520353 [Daucus carota subsp. sativus]
MAQPNHKKSSSNVEHEPYTEDGWSFEDVKKFETILYKFDTPPPPAFFEEVAHEMPWKTMKAIKLHYELLLKDLGKIKNLEFEMICVEDEGQACSICGEQSADSQSD